MKALLIHGLSSSASSWWRVAAALEEDGWEVTAPDLRGHGSAPRAETYSFADYVSDLPRAPWDLIVGHSLGGALTVLLAATAARLVLLDPLLEVPAHEFAAMRTDQLAELELTLELLRTEKPHWHPRDHESKIEAVAQADRTMVERTFDDNPHWNVVDDAKRLAVPTLILGADHAVYSMLPTETAHAIVTANPHVTYRVVKGSGHSPHRDRPDETIAAIREWVLPATVH